MSYALIYSERTPSNPRADTHPSSSRSGCRDPLATAGGEAAPGGAGNHHDGESLTGDDSKRGERPGVPIRPCIRAREGAHPG